MSDAQEGATPEKKKGASKPKPEKKQTHRKRHERDALFLAYAGLGGKRSFAELGRITGISERTIEKWSRLDGWKERIRELDANIRRQVEEEMVKDFVPTVVTLQKLRKQTIDNALNRMEAAGAGAKMLENKLAWEIARTELGLPTKFSKIDSTVERVLTTDDLEDMAKNGVTVVDEDEVLDPEELEDEEES